MAFPHELPSLGLGSPLSLPRIGVPSIPASDWGPFYPSLGLRSPLSQPRIGVPSIPASDWGPLYPSLEQTN
ncbi:hypothetical protein FKM82_030173 [Ascaphus truei]